jgi:hypothetical protein
MLLTGMRQVANSISDQAVSAADGLLTGQQRNAHLQRTRSSDVVGVAVRVDGVDELELQVFDELQVPVDRLEHGVDEDALIRDWTGNEVCVSAADWLEKLSNNGPGDLSGDARCLCTR